MCRFGAYYASSTCHLRRQTSAHQAPHVLAAVHLEEQQRPLGAGAAAGDAVSTADAWEASDAAEEIAAERYMDPIAEEDEPYDPAADAAALAAAQELHAGDYM
jgi:hypothetical protein